MIKYHQRCKKVKGRSKVDIVLRGSVSLSETQKKDELDEWFLWGTEFARENNLTKEKSRKLLKLARKIINESCD